MTAHIHAIGTAVPDHDIHEAFVAWAMPRIADDRERAVFRRMAARSGIRHRWSVLPRSEDGGSPVDRGGFYADALPPTSARMAVYAEQAPKLALQAIADLSAKSSLAGITHLVVASCTGFVAPGIDQIIAAELGLPGHVERTLVGFMGCYAAVAALRVAHHIARSEREARILVVTVELSTLHLQDAHEIEPLLAMLQFADGAAAALVSAEPDGIAIDRLFTATLPDSRELIRWTIGDQGFAMHLSGEVPGRIGAALGDPDFSAIVLGGQTADHVDSWAVHAGGRSILDAVEHALGLAGEALAASRAVLDLYGNMSSSTLMFVLKDLIQDPEKKNGIAMAFGPRPRCRGLRVPAALMRSLAHPAQEDEQMDAADLAPETYAQVLADLASVNRWTMAARPTIGFLKRALKGRRAFTLLDVGFGDGDMLRAIARWADKEGLSAKLTGVDLNPNSKGVAEAKTSAQAGISYVTGDYTDLTDQEPDFIVSSLVAHHMDVPQRIAFLRTMQAKARIGWFVNDLHRHRLAYLGFPMLACLMGWHRIVRQDGQLSIARSFRRAEWLGDIAAAGIDPATIRVTRRFPFRLCVEHIR